MLADILLYIPLLMRMQESMRCKPTVATGTIRMSRTREVALDGGRLRVPAMTSMWTPSHTMHNSTRNWGADARQYKPARVRRKYWLICKCPQWLQVYQSNR